MRTVPLAQVSAQSFTVTLDNVRWSLRFVSASDGVTACDVSRDGLFLLRGVRALAGEPLIPYAYLQTGNFIFVTLTDDLPQWQLFGVSQFLVYLSALEIAAIDAEPLTVGELDPFAPSFLLDNDGFYLTTDDGEILTDD